MSLQLAANHLAAQGRRGDSTLVHMSPGEVKSLQQLAMAHGGSLSINPSTGLPEASFLSSIMPMVIGGGLMAISGGAINPMTAGLLVGGLQAARTGSLQKGLMAGLGAYGGAGLASGLAGAGASALAAESAGAAFDPTTMATVGEGAAAGATPSYMGIDKLQAAYPEATMAELDAAQQSQNAMRTAAMEQQNVLNTLKPQQLGQTIDQIKTTTPMLDQIKAGMGTVSSSPSAAMSFLGDNAKPAFAAAAPVLGAMEMGNAPEVKGSGPNPYNYRYEPNVSTPFPVPDVPGYGDQGRNFGREQRYYSGRYVPLANGGPVEQMSNANAVGANTGFPMADMHTAAYATPYQTPISQNVLSGTEETNVDPYTGQERLAGGGMTGYNLGGYSDGGRLLRGPGDGVSDSIPATIGNKQPARLADGEFVVPARIVSELGNGSTEAGARQLYAMMDRVQKARGKTMGKGRVAKKNNPRNMLPA